MAGHDGFAGEVLRIKTDLLDFLLTAASEGRTVAGYGAPGKGNTLLNHCGIRSDLLAYTVDRSPWKQGKFLPGTHIPIYAPERIAETRPDYVLVLPWNLRDRDRPAARIRPVVGWPAGRSRSQHSKSSEVGCETVKVVLFCGGLGMRMRDGISTAPKPMAMVGERPLLWHVMRYYAHYGHTDFVLCLGYGASAVKDFFLTYDETRSNDFVIENGARDVKLFSTDISDWRITLVDTGLHSDDRRAAAPGPPVRRGEEMFMANYADVLTDGAAARHDRAVQGQRRGGQPAGRAASVVAPRGGHRRGRHHHPGDARCRTCGSGKTAATSCSGRRFSITSTRAKT